MLVGRTFLSTCVTGRTLAAYTRLHLAFPEKGKLTVHAGCNRIFGDVRIDGDRLKVCGLGSTAIGCDVARNKQDDWLKAFLRAGPAFALNGDELVLIGATEVIKFVDHEVERLSKPVPCTRQMTPVMPLSLHAIERSRQRGSLDFRFWN
jgi:heat shock protein HslJ